MDKKFVSKENAAVLYDALKSYVDTEVSDASTQYTVMPAASAENEGQIIQYTGETTENYTNGYFYQVISDGGDPATYSWENLNTQDTYFNCVIEGYNLDLLGLKKGIYLLRRAWEGFSVSTYYSPFRGGGASVGISPYNGILQVIVDITNNTPAGTTVAYFLRLNTSNKKFERCSLGLTYGQSGLTLYVIQDDVGYLTNGAQTISGVKTFSSLPESSVTPTTNNQLVNKFYVDDKAASIQTSYTTVPTADTSNEGKIIQYTGTTDSIYTNGYFYECVSDGQDPATYSWVAIPTQSVTHPEYTLAVATTTSGYAKSYELTKDGVATGVKIDIPKDLVISNGEVKTVTTADVPYAGAQVGDKYIDITLNDASANHIYIPVNDLVDAYTAGNGINIDNNNQVSIKLDSSNANGITVGANGISLAEATTNTSGAMSAADKTKLATVSSNADENVIEIVKVNGSALTPDQDKAVNVTVPTSLSDLDADAANLVHDASYVHTDNNYTTSEATKLNGIESGAEENIIEIVKVNGSALTPDADKAVNITVPSVPNFSSGTADPTGGSDGDIYFQYSA